MSNFVSVSCSVRVDTHLGVQGKDQQVVTVRNMNWLGKKNGELLGLTAFNGFDIFIALDKNLKHQQNLDRFSMKFIVLLAKDNKHQTMQPYIDKVKILLQTKIVLPKFSEVSL